MNSAQRKILLVGLLSIILMGLFPPWTVTQPAMRGLPDISRNWGYHFFFKEPKASSNLSQYSSLFNWGTWETEREKNLINNMANFSSFQINYIRLGLQWAFVVLVAGGLILLSRK